MHITSTGTLDKLDPKVREELAETCDLVSAMRFPGNAHLENAGTAVVTDMVILRKRHPGEAPGDRSWLQTVDVPDPAGGPTDVDKVHGYPLDELTAAYSMDGAAPVAIGSTRMPAVRAAVAAQFGREPLSNVNPDEVVDIGAALQAHSLAGHTRDGGILLLDVIPLSLGIETMGGLVERIVHRNETIPTAKAQDFTTYRDGHALLRYLPAAPPNNRRLALRLLHCHLGVGMSSRLFVALREYFNFATTITVSGEDVPAYSLTVTFGSSVPQVVVGTAG
jgi:hypothetical protein